MLALSHQYVGVSTKITSITKEHLSQNLQIVQHAYSLDIKQCPPKKNAWMYILWFLWNKYLFSFRKYDSYLNWNTRVQ